MKHNPIIQFQKNIESIKVLDAIYAYLNPKVTSFDLSEILRAEFVLLVSAFDCYIHDIVREGMLEIFEGDKSSNSDFENFTLPFKTVNQLINATDQPARKEIIDIAIKEITSKDSYQSPRSIENALGLISVKKIWTSLGKELSLPPDDIKKQLNLIINRRNKIAHEADIDRATGLKKAISASDIKDTMEFIETLAKTLDAIVNKI